MIGTELDWAKLAVELGVFAVGLIGLARAVAGSIRTAIATVEAKIEVVRIEATAGRKEHYDHLEKLYMPGGEVRAELRRLDQAIQEHAVSMADVAARMECPGADRRRAAGWPGA